VRFVGELDDVRDALAAMDVFVLPSHEEGMSNALLEAMAAGRAIVVTDVGGNREVVGSDAAEIVPSRDPGALAAAIARLLGDPESAREFGRAARRRVDERFGARTMIGGLERLYFDRLAAHGQLAA
jgi:glycosyltransferase involved in cell wall biosynthesis